MADIPLFELEESWVFGMLWPKQLLIFEDRIEIRGSELLRETAEAIHYVEIKEVVVGGEGWSASLLIKRSGKPILIRGVEEEAARYAKSLIEEHVSHLTDGLRQTFPTPPTKTDLIHKLTELRNAGVLSPEEFESKRKAIEARDR